MLRLMLHGAMGTLAESESVERFEFDHMEVKPTLAQSRRELKVAYLPDVVALHGLAQSIWVVPAGTAATRFEFSESRLTEVLLFPPTHRIHIRRCSNFFEARP